MEEQAMQFVDDEFLLLSRGGRISPGTQSRSGRARTAEEQARRELAAHAARQREPLPVRFSAVLSKAAAAITGASGGAGRSEYGGER
jgi:hypothetical protein